MKKIALSMTLTALLMLPVGCQNNYQLAMDSGPWGLPMVKLQKTSKVRSDLDPFIQDGLEPPPRVLADIETKPDPTFRSDSKVRQASLEAPDRTGNPFE